MTFDLSGFGGSLLRPGDDGYDEARRVFNGMIDRRPRSSPAASTVDDVVAAVKMARDGTCHCRSTAAATA